MAIPDHQLASLARSACQRSRARCAEIPTDCQLWGREGSAQGGYGVAGGKRLCKKVLFPLFFCGSAYDHLLH